MAAFTDIATLQFQGTSATGQAIRNTLHLRRNPTAGQVDATFLAALAGDANTTTLITAYKALLRVADRLNGVLFRATLDPLFPDDDRDEFFKVVDAAGTTANPAVSCPQEATSLIKLGSDRAGRRFRGRIWLPPLADGALIVGEDMNAAGAYPTARTAFVTELVKTTYPSGAGHYGGAWNDVDLVVFSRKGREVDGDYYARVVTVTAPLKIRWLRSRNPSQG